MIYVHENQPFWNTEKSFMMMYPLYFLTDGI